MRKKTSYRIEEPRAFLPATPEEIRELGWKEPDFLLISGDAYVDHPSFGPAVIGRVLESRGFRVAILPQPDWNSLEEFASLGKPRLGVLVTAGNLDSLLSNRTAAGKPRRSDSYSPGGKGGGRPDRATLVYCNRIRQLWKDVPLIIGGIEASLRRFAHYDYWSRKVRRSLLMDSRADLLIYGMGELQIAEIARLLEKGVPVHSIRNVPGTCYLLKKGEEAPGKSVLLPGFEEVEQSKDAFGEAFRLAYEQQNPFSGRPLVQPSGESRVVQNPPPRPLSSEELDAVYELPYCRAWHPRYDTRGGVPALEEVRFSLVSQRGCFGECSFCSLTFHQGRIIQKRSVASLVREAELLTTLEGFKGYIHDVGGPTANFRIPPCEKQASTGGCPSKRCLGPEPCSRLKADHQEYLELLERLREVPGVTKVFIRSGIRYDYLLLDAKTNFLEELCTHHVSGQLKVAPEHSSFRVTRLMGKPGIQVFSEFAKRYAATNRRIGKEQYLVPYFMSSHPGSGLREAVDLAEFLRDGGYRPEQVQDFVPTPGTLSTCMYYTGKHPLTGEEVYVPREEREKLLQRALMQYWMPQNYPLVREALREIGRGDLIGRGSKCLVPPEEGVRGGDLPKKKRSPRK